MEPGSGWVRRTGSPLQGWMDFSRDSADGAEHALTKRHLSQLALINYLIGQKTKERNGSRWRGEQVAACLNSNPGRRRRRREDCLCQLPRGGAEEEESAARRGGVELGEDDGEGLGRRRCFWWNINVVARLAGPPCQTRWLTPCTLGPPCQCVAWRLFHLYGSLRRKRRPGHHLRYALPEDLIDQ